MQVLAVVGTDPPLAATAELLDGPVAVVRADPNATDDGEAITTGRDSPGGETAAGEGGRATPTGRFALAGDGTWRGTTAGEGFGQLLDRLAHDYDHALVAGASRLRLPTVVVGDHEPAGEVVRRFASDDPAVGEPETYATAVRDVEPYVTLETLVAATKRAAGEEFAGAIATFTGRVRARDDPAEPATTHLSFEKYEGVAADRLARIERELADRDGVYDVRTHHRTGPIAAGEDIVFVVVLAGHREEAFRTVSDGIDRLKDEVPIFKKEITTDDAFWRHDRE